MNKYDDIINLPHHVSKTRPQLPMENRAAQFAPFAALTGHDEAIAETARVTDKMIELTDEEQIMLSLRINNAYRKQAQISITYFQPDKQKEGGRYTTITGKIKKIDTYSRAMTLIDGPTIPLDHIIELK